MTVYTAARRANPSTAADGQGPHASGALLFRISEALVRRRISISIWVIVLLMARNVVAGLRPHSAFDVRDPWTIAGLMLALGGLAIRSWAAGALRKNSTLATHGAYAVSRNPLYLGSFLMMLGFCALLGDVLNYVALTLLVALVYWPQIRKEEAHLTWMFGESWFEYAQSTPRLIPRRLFARGIAAEWSRAQWVRNHEQRAVLGVALGLAAIELWHRLT